MAGARRIQASVGSVNLDADIEQAWLRVGVCLIGFVYVWFLILTEGQITSGLAMGLAASFGDMAVGAGMIWWMRRDSQHRVPLRYLGIASDKHRIAVKLRRHRDVGTSRLDREQADAIDCRAFPYRAAWRNFPRGSRL